MFVQGLFSGVSNNMELILEVNAQNSKGRLSYIAVRGFSPFIELY